VDVHAEIKQNTVTQNQIMLPSKHIYGLCSLPSTGLGYQMICIYGTVPYFTAYFNVL